MKKILGISSKSYLHSGELRGYAQTVRKISTTAKVLSNGTYVGVVLDVGVGALEIQEACSIGREDVCTKAKYVESGRTVGGILGSAAGGLMGGSIAGGICVALGLPSGGTITVGCFVIGSVAGAVGGRTEGAIYGAQKGTTLFSSFEE